MKEIGSLWRVVGPGGKLLDGKYKLKQQALAALKSEVNKLFEETKYGFLKDVSDSIEQTLNSLKEELNGKEIKISSNDGEGTNDCKGNDEGHENGQKSTQENEVKEKSKKVRGPKVSSTIKATMRRHNI